MHGMSRAACSMSAATAGGRSLALQRLGMTSRAMLPSSQVLSSRHAPGSHPRAPFPRAGPPEDVRSSQAKGRARSQDLRASTSDSSADPWQPSRGEAADGDPQAMPWTMSAGASRAIDDYLATLNDEQREAVCCAAPAVRVKAGPGSGKTRAVVARAAHQLQQGVHPDSLLVITFTNKAAGELKERLGGLLGGAEAKRLTAGTFHSICSNILRQYVHLLPGAERTTAFSIMNQNDSQDVMREAVDLAMEELHKTPKAVSGSSARSAADMLCSLLSDLKNRYGTLHGIWWTRGRGSRHSMPPLPAMDVADQVVEDQVLAELSRRNDAGVVPSKSIPQVFGHYERICRHNNCIDFDDLLCLVVALLRSAPQVLRILRSKWQHVLVDEFQDTNSAQYELVRQLRQPCSTTFVVGDPDQAIYTWRGANPENMAQAFEADFPGCVTVNLKRNYRSGSHILSAAEAVLGHGRQDSVDQRLVPMTGIRGHVEVVQVADHHDEGKWVARKILELHSTPGTCWQDFAVLYRKGSQSLPLEQAFMTASPRHKIPMRIIGGKPFWSYKEIRVMVSYLRLALNPRDGLALQVALSNPPRSIGPKAKERLDMAARERCTSAAELLFGDLVTQPPLPEDELCVLIHHVEMNQSLPESSLSLLPDVPATVSAELGVKLDSKQRKAFQALRVLLHVARSTVVHWSVAAALRLLQVASGYEARLKGDQDTADEDNVVDGDKHRGSGTDRQLRRLAILHEIANDPDCWVTFRDVYHTEQWGPEWPDLPDPSSGDGTGERPDSSSQAADGSTWEGLYMLQLFLQHVTLMTSGDEDVNDGEDEGRVSLMTMHGAKGLEFKHVFLVGFEDGLVPLIRFSESESNLDEEQRLAYVGCTRAKESLYLLHAQMRTDGRFRDAAREQQVSRYIRELESRGCSVKYTHVDKSESNVVDWSKHSKHPYGWRSQPRARSGRRNRFRQ